MAGRRISWLLSLGLLSGALCGGYLPPSEDGDETTRASGTRGCPVPLGELYLVGQQLKTQHSQPTLLFWVSPAAPPGTLLVVVKDRNFQPVFVKKVTVQEIGYYPVNVQAELKPLQEYVITGGLLCQESRKNAAVLETSLTRVESATALDRRIEAILAKIREAKPKTRRLAPEMR